MAEPGGGVGGLGPAGRPSVCLLRGGAGGSVALLSRGRPGRSGQPPLPRLPSSLLRRTGKHNSNLDVLKEATVTLNSLAVWQLWFTFHM